jgi:hypothetical protein
MAEDEKAVGRRPCREPHSSPEGGKSARKRAPDQDVLPGILGKQLKAAYGELLNAPIPDAFTDLIKRLEDQEPTERPAEPERSPEESDQ